jgi:hypothetical protein
LSGIGRADLVALSGSGHYAEDGDGATKELSGRVTLSSTLAFAEGVFAATSFPGSALALLAPSSELKSQLVELRPFGAASVASEGGRTAVIGGLVPYADYEAGVELPKSPPDAQPVPASIELRPEYRSIAVLRVGLAPSIAIRGTLVDASMVPVANIGSVVAMPAPEGGKL